MKKAKKQEFKVGDLVWMKWSKNAVFPARVCGCSGPPERGEKYGAYFLEIVNIAGNFNKDSPLHPHDCVTVDDYEVVRRKPDDRYPSKNLFKKM